jgi:hypothetical protein
MFYIDFISTSRFLRYWEIVIYFQHLQLETQVKVLQHLSLHFKN